MSSLEQENALQNIQYTQMLQLQDWQSGMFFQVSL